MAEKYKKPKKDTWVRDYAGTNKKVDAYIKSQGGNEWDMAGFRQYMDYHSARQKQLDESNSKAVSSWNTTHEESYKKQQEKEAKSLKEQIKKSEEQRKKRAQQNKSLVPQLSKKQKEERNGFQKVMDTINSPLKAIDKAVLQPAERLATSFTDGLLLGQVKKNVTKNNAPSFVQKAAQKPSTTAEKVIDTAGEFAGMVAPISASYKVASPLVKPLAKVLPQAGKVGTASKLLQTGIRGGTAMGVYGTTREGLDEAVHPNGATFEDRAKRVRNDVIAGAVLDPAFSVGGMALKKGFESASSRTMKNLLPKNETVAKEFANAYKSSNALPVPNRGSMMNDLLQQGNDITNPNFLPKLNAAKHNEIPVPKIGNSINELPPLKAEDISLSDRLNILNSPERSLPDFSYGKPKSEPNPPVNVYGVEVPYDKVQHAPSDYWRSRYEEFSQFVNKNYDSSKLNKEALDDLWTQFARYDEPVTLDEVVDLAYKPQEPVLNASDVWDKMGNRQPVSKTAQKILFGNKKPTQELVPSLKPRKTVQEPLNTPGNTIVSEPMLSPSKDIQEPKPVAKSDVDIFRESNLQSDSPKPVQPKQADERSFYNTVRNPEKLSPEMEQLLNDFDKTYKPMSNEETVKFANKYVAKDMEKAYQFVKNARKFDPRHITVGHRLIDELQKAGQYDKALDVVERLAEQGTKAGQSIQSYSIYNRLTAEGQLVRAQRHINKINQDITDPAKQVKLTPQHVEDITQTADSIQKFAGQMEQANNVMKIMENVKKGKAATDSELETVRSFVTDAKKFFGDLAPNVTAPKVKPVKDVRTRDKVVDFMSKKEDVARKELQKIFGRANSMPVDAFYHLSVIGASKIAKGTVKLADFTEEMAMEFGETVRPYAKQIYNKAVETFNLQSESMTRQRLSEVEKITNRALKDKNLSVDEVDTIKEFARRVGQMSGDAKLEASMELQTTLQALERPTFGQKLSAAQTISQLLNPKTIVRNAIGNEMFYRVEQMNKLLATPIDIARSKITGGERTITFVSNNQGQYWRNWLTGAKAGWKGVNPMGLQTMYDIGPQSFRSKWNPLTYLEKSLGATLRSFDHAGYMRAYNKTLGELATLRAVNQGLKGQAKKDAIAQFIREADENMIQMADQYGKYATFQDSTMLSTALQKVKKGMNKVSTLGATEDFGLGDLVLKYPKTPGNLVMRALEYSPVGLIRSASILKAAYKTKDPFNTKEGTLAITRAIMGTGGFSLLGYVLADKGILTAAGNSDYEVASLERNAGKQPNSVNTSALARFISSGFNLDEAGTKEGDTFVSYDWAQPISIAVALGTGINQSVKENGKLNVGEAIKGGVDSSANTVINQSVLKGLNDFLANYPGRTMSDRVGDAAKGIAGSFVPTLSNQVRQVGDNTSRSTYSPNLLPEIKNRAINRVPGLQKSLPPAYDTLGNKKETYQNKGNNLFNVFLNPSFVSKYKPSPEAKFVLDMINLTGDKSLAPRIAQKKLDGKPLTSKQYSEMQRIMGEEVKQGLSGLSGPSNDEATRKAIEKILREAGKTAREAIRAERGE